MSILPIKGTIESTTLMKFKGFYNFIFALTLSAGITGGSYVFAPNFQLFSFSPQLSTTPQSNKTQKFDIISIFNLIEENECRKDSTSHLSLGFIPPHSYTNICKVFPELSITKLSNRFFIPFKNKLNILNCSFLI